MKLKAYTDGSCIRNKYGGYCAAISNGKKLHLMFGGESKTTSNRMELMGAIAALEFASCNFNKRDDFIEVLTDSKYVQNGITKWIKGWKKNNWITKAKKTPVMNKKYWVWLDQLNNELSGKVRWSWVKGHNGNKMNEIADKIAGQSSTKSMDKHYQTIWHDEKVLTLKKK